MRAGDPLTLHWLGPPATPGMRRAWCGAVAPEPAWRCVDDDEITLAECQACVAAVEQARAEGRDEA